MRTFYKTAASIETWATREANVRCLLWYGSLARDDVSAGSDLDMALILDEGDSTAVLDSLRDHLAGRLRFDARMPGTQAQVLWLDRHLHKLEVQFAHEPSDLNWIASAVDVPSPRLRLGVDKDGTCTQLLSEAARDIAADSQSLIDTEIDKFLVAYEASSCAHRRSDGYQSYFQHNLALQRLARLYLLSRKGADRLYLPSQFLSSVLSMDEQLAFRQLNGTLYLPEANDRKRRLLSVFYEVLAELDRKYGCARSLSEIEQFCEAVFTRDYFLNVRDFADAYDGRIRRGVLFRCSQLTRWQAHPELRLWLHDNRVGTIIDFRDPEESAEMNAEYLDETLAGIDYVRLPLSDKPDTGATTTRTPWSRAESYFEDFRSYAANAVAAFREVASPVDCAVAVHCHAGKDRTGWFCATLAVLLGMPRACVMEDYLLSGQDVEQEILDGFLEKVAQMGGPSAALNGAGLDDALIGELKKRLLTEPTPSA